MIGDAIPLMDDTEQGHGKVFSDVYLACCRWLKRHGQLDVPREIESFGGMRTNNGFHVPGKKTKRKGFDLMCVACHTEERSGYGSRCRKCSSAYQKARKHLNHGSAYADASARQGVSRA